VLDRVIARYRVDPDQVVAAGISSGASTGWEVVKACPDRFAGLVVIAGWTTATRVARLRGVPVWAFYAGLDPIAPPPLAARGVRALRASGGCARLSVDPWQSHWFTQEVLRREDLWAWILSRRRREGHGHAEGR
jgi:predicted peptidase